MSWILTHTGKKFDFENVKPSDICIEDIAQALAKTCRFNGHCHGFYSVAQHSVLVSNLVSKERQLEALLHDATEAYIGDMVTPLKNLFPGFNQYESYLYTVIARKFNLPSQLSEEVKHADLVMLATEKHELMTLHPEPWPILETIKPLSTPILCWNPKQAYDAFMDRFNELKEAAC